MRARGPATQRTVPVRRGGSVEGPVDRLPVIGVGRALSGARRTAGCPRRGELDVVAQLAVMLYAQQPRQSGVPPRSLRVRARVPARPGGRELGQQLRVGLAFSTHHAANPAEPRWQGLGHCRVHDAVGGDLADVGRGERRGPAAALSMTWTPRSRTGRPSGPPPGSGRGLPPAAGPPEAWRWCGRRLSQTPGGRWRRRPRPARSGRHQGRRALPVGHPPEEGGVTMSGDIGRRSVVVGGPTLLRMRAARHPGARRRDAGP